MSDESTLDSFETFAEGKEWYDVFYHEVIESLGLSEQRDIDSRDLLSKLLIEKPPPNLTEIDDAIRGKVSLLMGAGPSAETDILGLEGWINSERPFIAAADGAADALLARDIEADAILTDLDSCSEIVLLEQSAKGKPIIVHAHGDNLNLIESIVPKLGPGVLGSTQVMPVQNIVNIGGFTDGDRTGYFLAHFSPRIIVIAGMDLGPVEGSFSKARVKTAQDNRSKDFRKIKLGWGKRSLEYLVSKHPDIQFLNSTRWGVEIQGTKSVDYMQLKKQCTS